MKRVVAYLRVSSEDQAESGAGLAAQRHDIEERACVRDWGVAECGGWTPASAAASRGGSGPASSRRCSSCATGRWTRW